MLTFDVNHPVLFVLVGLIIAAVLGQSVFFLVRAVNRAKEKGMDSEIVKKTIINSVIFTIAPAISILIGVLTLSKSLGVALPWLRLSIIGSLTYETTAAATAVNAYEGATLGEFVIDNASMYVTVVWVMTLGIMLGVALVPFVTPKIQAGMKSIEKRDRKWGDILSDSLFMGMISAFLGYVFCDFSSVFSGETYGLIPVIVMIISALLMVVLGILAKKTKARWLYDYALPICLIVGMGIAIPLTNLLGA